MSKRWSFCAVIMLALCLAGCSKFEPTESTIFIQSNGQVKSAVMESFAEPYYDFTELSENVQRQVEAYCTEVKNGNAIEVESLTEEEDEVTLMMTYLTVKDYTEFNQVALFAGTYEEAVAAGYEPKDLYDEDGTAVVLSEKETRRLNVVVTEENICVQTNGRIKYVSDNVTIAGKRLAKSLEAGKNHPAYILYK